MTRGAYTTKFKPMKPAKVDDSASLWVSGVPSMATKPTRANSSWASIRTATFLTRNVAQSKLASPASPDQTPQESEGLALETDETEASGMLSPDWPLCSPSNPTTLESYGPPHDPSSSLSVEVEIPVRPATSRTSSTDPSAEEDAYEPVFDKFEELTIQETQSSTSSSYSEDSSSIFSKDNASTYSSGASMYSFDDIAEEAQATINSRLASGPQYQQRARPVTAKRPEPQDAASREASTLAKKAALFKNSRLPPQLPSFGASLPTWSIVCRAIQASLDCYDSRAVSRRGVYTPANTSKDIKAMIVDEQLIDDSRLVIVAIRGTECKSLTDWTVNTAAKPVNPVGFLDDEENACHAGFLNVTKAMVSQVATQLQEHPATSERPSLLITGHSAGGAVASMLYSHMLSTSVQSELTALASQFSSINCVTFGAPPLSLTPLPKRDHVSGVFLSFANEGDPVLRLSDAAYVKSLAKLMAVLPPAAAVPAKAKVVRRSRGTSVVREVVAAAPAVPWEELPLWPTPAPPLCNAGDVILLRDKEDGRASASLVTREDLREVIFGDLAQHTVDVYMRRVKRLALAAMMGL
jgi:hypothetical protein